ncbi:Di-copper centre-containing protein [Pseudovirgaria hyperparasitica]|uniref:tyrosinase n=1 Tax=Pseudovirgaria hyperparasitica TaxID=470096 RepID=A0A6A6VZ40_9PEZI|nr:Di-copper centre-containing protein [Pseudovirgaria hyperparasitica]KAF2755505.1 Di-copper centre-containing protein [Pseudovirgaria hyperparasitica]
MLGLSSITVLLALATLAISSPLQRLEDHITQIGRRQSGTFAVTGATGGAYPRLEIRDMQKNAPLWNLFLAALERWQAVDQDDKTSYFQIAAIHGQPLIPWDGVGATGSNQVGMCPHDSNVFGTWHRPYLALLEQLLQVQAFNIANSLPDGDTKSKTRDLANQLRFPYWDWAMNPPNGGPILPDSVTAQTVTIVYPDGTKTNRPNPLFQYRFHPLKANWFGGAYNKWDHTVRNPADVNNVQSPSNNGEAESKLQQGHANRRSSLYNILTQHQTFNQFSNHGTGNSPIGNLETIHDGVHQVFGEGHMQYLTVSAFDPVFWLHHINVDRLITLFQTVYPDTWVEPWSQHGDTWVYKSGTTLNSDSALLPFHASTDGLSAWNSAAAADWTRLGYTYPELVNRPSNASVRSAINKLYGNNQAAQKGISSRKRNASGKTYLAAIEAPVQALDGPYEVEVWLGPIDGKTLGYGPSSYVGSMAILATPGMNMNNVIRASVPLTERLNENGIAGILPDLGLDSILWSLKKELHYRVMQKGVEVPKERIPGLKVAVFSADVSPAATDEDFPIWGDLTKHNDITDGWSAWDDDT